MTSPSSVWGSGRPIKTTTPSSTWGWKTLVKVMILVNPRLFLFSLYASDTMAQG